VSNSLCTFDSIGRSLAHSSRRSLAGRCSTVETVKIAVEAFPDQAHRFPKNEASLGPEFQTDVNKVETELGLAEWISYRTTVVDTLKARFDLEERVRLEGSK
jgi:hypothetical protein